MTPQELRDRTDRFAVDIVKFCRGLARDPNSLKLSLQLQGAATSVAANYHAACRARSRAEFVAKLCTVVEEADESVLWLDTIEKAEVARGAELTRLLQEASELLSIFSASRKTASGRRRRRDK
jgi:four helix bundle protein